MQIKRFCEQCGKEFYTISSKVNRGKGRFCSKDCFDKSRVDKVKCVCSFCGNEFFVVPSQITRGAGKYCSRSCKGRAGLTKFKPGHEMPNDIRDKISVGLTGRPCSAETREKLRIGRTGKLHSPDTKQKLHESHLGQIAWNKGVPTAPEVKLKLSKSHIGIQAKEKHPAWKGGVSFLPYCPKFDRAFKNRIRERFRHKCFLCDPDNAQKDLCVHHIDYNKNSICNGHSWAFVPLCRKHHGMTNYNRWYWFNLLICYWAMNPEINFILGDSYYGIYQVSRFLGGR